MDYNKYRRPDSFDYATPNRRTYATPRFKRIRKPTYFNRSTNNFLDIRLQQSLIAPVPEPRLIRNVANSNSVKYADDRLKYIQDANFKLQFQKQTVKLNNQELSFVKILQFATYQQKQRVLEILLHDQTTYDTPMRLEMIKRLEESIGKAPAGRAPAGQQAPEGQQQAENEENMMGAETGEADRQRAQREAQRQRRQQEEEAQRRQRRQQEDEAEQARRQQERAETAGQQEERRKAEQEREQTRARDRREEDDRRAGYTDWDPTIPEEVYRDMEWGYTPWDWEIEEKAEQEIGEELLDTPGKSWAETVLGLGLWRG